MAKFPRPPAMGVDMYGDSPVREFEIANGLTGLSHWYKLPKPFKTPVALEQWLDLRMFPLEGTPRVTPEKNLSDFNTIVDRALALNPELSISARLQHRIQSEHLILRGIAHGFNSSDINYSIRRILTQDVAVPTVVKFQQMALDEMLRERLERVGAYIRRRHGTFKSPGRFWQISPETMTQIEEQVGVPPYKPRPSSVWKPPDLE